MALAIAAAASLGLVGCSGGSVTANNANAGGRTTVLMWHNSSGGELKELNKLVQRFNSSQSKYTIQPQFDAEGDTFTSKMVNALKNNQGPNMVIGDYSPQFLSRVIDVGKVVELGPLMDKAGSTVKPQDFPPGMLAIGNYNGKIYSLPTDGGDFALIYNKKKFKEAGIANPPTTWAELAADAAKLTKGKQQYGMYLPIGTGEWPVYTWEPMLWSAGGQLLSSDNKQVMFDSPAGVKALTAWTDMVKNGTAYPQSLGANANLASMTSGKVAMVIDGAWDLSSLDQALGAENVGVAPVPGIEKPAMNIGTNVGYIIKGTPQQEAGAWKFLQWWLSPSLQAEWDVNTGYLPTNLKTADTATWKDFVAKNPRIQVFAEELKYATGRPSIPGYGALSDALSNEIEKALLLKESPSAALKAAASKAQAALK